MVNEYGISIRQACKEIQFPRSSFSYQNSGKNDDLIIEQLALLIDN
jgi:hypothetical protein